MSQMHMNELETVEPPHDKNTGSRRFGNTCMI